MPLLPTDFSTMDSGSILDALVDAATARGILIADGASDEELESAQRKVDVIAQELQRHIAW
jgi:hypothetical protein